MQNKNKTDFLKKNYLFITKKKSCEIIILRPEIYLIVLKTDKQINNDKLFKRIIIYFKIFFIYWFFFVKLCIFFSCVGFFSF